MELYITRSTSYSNIDFLKRLFRTEQISLAELTEELKNAYMDSFDQASLENAIRVLEGRFVSKEEEYQKYKAIDIQCLQ